MQGNENIRRKKRKPKHTLSFISPPELSLSISYLLGTISNKEPNDICNYMYATKDSITSNFSTLSRTFSMVLKYLQSLQQGPLHLLIPFFQHHPGRGEHIHKETMTMEGNISHKILKINEKIIERDKYRRYCNLFDTFCYILRDQFSMSV